MAPTILNKIQKSLKTCPKNTDLADVNHLQLILKPHQKRALSWLLWREKQNPSGGIFADDMGLGKTLTMISLIIKSIEEESEDDQSQNGVFIGGTLVVCPATLVNHWKEEVNKRVKKKAHITVGIFHGRNRETKPKRLASHDIVITTYSTLLSECQKKGIIFKIKWRRLILDEAHQIRNQETKAFEAVMSVETTSRWAMTGTPIHNSDTDMYSMMKFLEFAPFNDEKVWNEWLKKEKDLKIIMSFVMLRRTKEELEKLKELKYLPIKYVEEIKVELKKEEMEMYRKYEKFSRSDAKKNIFVQLLRLRQICCHPFLITSMLEDGSKQRESGEMSELFKDFDINGNKKDAGSSKKSMSIFSEDYRSSKIEILLGRLKDIIAHGDKTVVVSQWAKFLRIIAHHVGKEKISFYILVGTTPVEERMKIVNKFNNLKSTVKVLLLSLTAGGVGLNLVGGNHLFLMDIHWNPQLENQAQDRVYRMGQTKPVIIYKFITVHTVEEKIKVVQDKKLKIADSLFAGQNKEELSPEDLQIIFNSKK